MNLDELRSVQTRERQKDELQHLQDDFYQRVGEFITDLKDQRERAADRAESPFDSPEVKQLTDEINTAEEVAESIYERRMGKLVKAASLSASDYSTETEGLTAEEQALFDDLVDRITDNKDAVLDVLAGKGEQRPANNESDTSAESDPQSPEDTTEATAPLQSDESSQSVEATTDGGRTTVQTPPQSAPEPAPADQSNAKAPSDDRITVQVLEDIGDILGVDEQQYDLASDDVVSLPAPNAEPLIEQDVVEPIDGNSRSLHD